MLINVNITNANGVFTRCQLLYKASTMSIAILSKFWGRRVRSASRFIFYVGFQSFQYHLLNRDICFILLPIFLCQISVDYNYRGLLMGSLFRSVYLFASFSPVPCYLDYCRFKVSLEVR